MAKHYNSGVKMKARLFITVMIFIGILSIQNSAQDKNHVHRVTTWQIKIPLKGTRKQLDKLINEWILKIGKENHSILNYEFRNHHKGKGSKFIIIDEHSNWGTFEEGNKERGSFIINAWPIKEKRDLFFNLLKTYISSRTEKLYEINDNYFK